MTVVAVIQARTGSTRLPGKVLAPIGAWPMFVWTIAALRSVRTIDLVVLATSDEPADDGLAAAAARLVLVHRGSARDVLARVWGAAAVHGPDFIVRATADNPFPDPDVVAAQVAACVSGVYDYIGTSDYPLGIAAEVARAGALETAAREATAPPEREHVMPFLYNHPDRFRIGSLPPCAATLHSRYTVDTLEDLEFARALAVRIGHPPPVRLSELEAIVAREPGLADLNAGVRQRHWEEVER